MNVFFFADIDHLAPECNFDDFLKVVVDKYNELANPIREVNVDDILVFKREDSDRYHIYIPALFGEVSKAKRVAIYKAVNSTFNEGIIDEAAHTIRVEGFMKYDREKKQFIAGSRYLPRGKAQNLAIDDLFHLLEDVWLNPSGFEEEDEFVMLDKDECAPENLLNDDNDAKAESLPESRGQTQAAAGSREGSVDIVNPKITPEIEARIKLNYPEISHILLKYPIVGIKVTKGCVTFGMDKSFEGRSCKIAKRVHTRNNIYLVYHVQKKALYQKCFNDQCRKKAKVLIYKVERKVDKAIMKKHDVPLPNDVELAEYFVRWQQYIAVEKKKKGSTAWYLFNDDVGYWKKSSQEMIMNLMMGPFRLWVKKRYDEAIERCAAEQEEDLADNWKAIQYSLTHVRSLNAIAQAVTWQLANHTQIEWNSNDCYTVFPNGVTS